MHIPDGFISPQTYLPAAILSAGLLYMAYKKIDLDIEKIPFVAGVSALSFVMMLIIIPFPGGTSVHLSGIAIIALLFGAWTSFAALSLVLLLQALLFGEGGITSLSVNILALAFLGSFNATLFFSLFSKYSKKIAIFIAGFASIVIPSIFVAFILGLQPIIASKSGSPLYFPFGWDVTFISVVVPHFFLGIIEAFVTLSVVTFLQNRYKDILSE